MGQIKGYLATQQNKKKSNVHRDLCDKRERSQNIVKIAVIGTFWMAPYQQIKFSRLAFVRACLIRNSLL